MSWKVSRSNLLRSIVQPHIIWKRCWLRHLIPGPVWRKPAFLHCSICCAAVHPDYMQRVRFQVSPQKCQGMSALPSWEFFKKKIKMSHFIKTHTSLNAESIITFFGCKNFKISNHLKNSTWSSIIFHHLTNKFNVWYFSASPGKFMPGYWRGE